MELKNSVNNGKRVRIDGFDIARGMAVIFMIAIHVQMVYSTPEASGSLFGYLLEFLGGPLAAPVFMLLMGASFAFSKNRGTMDGIKRGLTIIFYGYLLNLFRAVLPALIYRLLLSDMGIENGVIPDSLGYSKLLLFGDILQFAGIALIVLTLLRKYRLNYPIIIAISCVIPLISPLLWEVKVNLPLIGHITDLLWGDEPLSGFMENSISFPAFPWLVFPLLGFVVGNVLKQSANINRTMGIMALVGLLLLVPGTVLLVLDFDYQLNDYYHARFGFIIFMTGIVLIWLYICQIVANSAVIMPVRSFITNCSRNVTSIYSIQWIIIIWLVFLIPVYSLGIVGTVGLMGIILVLSYLLSHFYQALKAKLTQPLENIR